MTGTVSPAIPTIGDPNSTEDADTRSGIITLRDALNAVLTSANTLDGAQIAAGTVPSAAYADNTIALARLANQTAGRVLIANASGVVTGTTLSGDVTVDSSGATAIGAGKVTGTMLAASTQVAYRSIANAVSSIEGGVAAGTYILGSDTVAPASPFTSGSDITNNASTFPPYFYFDDADWTVGTLTPKLRLRAQVAANATQPTITFTFGLYPITVAGGASALTMTLGTVVTNSTVAIASPAASTVTSGVTSDFTVPADGAYALGVVTNNTLTASNASLLSAQLQVRNV